jgi:hypothetical protein
MAHFLPTHDILHLPWRKCGFLEAGCFGTRSQRTGSRALSEAVVLLFPAPTDRHILYPGHAASLVAGHRNDCNSCINHRGLFERQLVRQDPHRILCFGPRSTRTYPTE